jgi:addiction module HigA family antidote
MKALPNIHPGAVLLEEFLHPLGISQNALARAAGVPPRRINEIVLGKRGITADTAVRLAAALGTSERFWLGLQPDYDLEEWAMPSKRSNALPHERPVVRAGCSRNGRWPA